MKTDFFSKLEVMSNQYRGQERVQLTFPDRQKIAIR